MESTTTRFSYKAGSLYYSMQELKDVRKRRGIRYELSIILLFVVLAA